MPDFYLPCEYGKKLKCTQGNDNAFSHKGKAEYAYDFKSTETANFNICATASGVVKKVVDSNSKTGLVESNPANYILIYHEPDCYSLYLHIAKNTAKVKKGDIIKQGQPIANAGNVGYADGIHLHFQIQKEESSWGQSISFQFEESSSVEENHFYTSQNKWIKSAADYHSQASYPTLTAGGDAVEWWIKFTNTGEETWENHNQKNKITKLALGTFSDPDIQEGRDFQCGWESPTRLAVVSPDCVRSGELGTFTFKIKAPSSMSSGKYRLQVTPKSPEGWLKQKDGQELNCFVDIQVEEKATIDDLFETSNDNLFTGCMMPTSENDLFSQSTGLSTLLSANADIKNVKWEKDSCLPDENVKIDVKLHDVPDGTPIDISIMEKDTKSCVMPSLSGIAYNNTFEHLMTINWIDSYQPETNQDLFVISAVIKDGDNQPAVSNSLHVDTLNYIFL